jgi:hypothetical protein
MKKAIYGRMMKIISGLAALILMSAAAACAANPEETEKLPDKLYGTYIFDSAIYSNPLSSVYVGDGYEEYYELTEDKLIIISKADERQEIEIDYDLIEVDETEFSSTSPIAFYSPDISGFKERFLVAVSDIYPIRLYLMDSELWLVQINQDPKGDEFLWSIFRIVSYDGKIPAGPNKAERAEMIDAAYSMAQEWYESAYQSGTDIDKSTAFINDLTDVSGIMEVIFLLPDKKSSVGISFEESDGKWAPVHDDALTVHDGQQAETAAVG